MTRSPASAIHPRAPWARALALTAALTAAATLGPSLVLAILLGGSAAVGESALGFGIDEMAFLLLGSGGCAGIVGLAAFALLPTDLAARHGLRRSVQLALALGIAAAAVVLALVGGSPPPAQAVDLLMIGGLASMIPLGAYCLWALRGA